MHANTSTIERVRPAKVVGKWYKTALQCLINPFCGLLMVVVFASVVMGYFHNQFWCAADEGAYAHVADRILQGEVLNRDVQDVHLGYINFANSLAFWLFGNDLVSLRYPLVAMGVFSSIMIFFLLIDQGLPMAVLGGIVVASLSLIQFLNPTAHWYCLFLLLITVGCLTWLPPQSRWRLVIVGFLVGTIILFRQLTGVITAIGVLTYLLIEAPRGAKPNNAWIARGLCVAMFGGLVVYLYGKTNPGSFLLFGTWPLGILAWTFYRASVPNREVVRILIRAMLGGLVAMLPLVIYHIWNGSLMSWLNDTVLCAFALTELDFFKHVNYGKLATAAMVQVGAPVSVAACLNGLFWITVLLVPVMLGCTVMFQLVRTDSSMRALPILAVFYSLVSLHFQIPIYLFYSLAVSLSALIGVSGAGPMAFRRMVACVAIFLSAAGLMYHAGQPLARGFQGIVQGQQLEMKSTDGLDRCSLCLEPADVQLYAYLVRLVDREVPRNGTILALPVNPELYYLTRRNNPCRFFNSALGIRSREDLQDVLATISRQPPTLVFHRPKDKYNTPLGLEVVKLIQQRYELLESRGGFNIYRLVATNQN